MDKFDVAIIGGGPTGATAANDLARKGIKVLLLDKAGRIKPCGGAVPPKLVREFEIPESLLAAKVTTARMIAPSNKAVDMPVGGWVGMVDREVFDEWLRNRAEVSGATRITGQFRRVLRDMEQEPIVEYVQGTITHRVRATTVIGADGAASRVAKSCIPGAKELPNVFAYHEIVRKPENPEEGFDGERCDVYYQGECSPDFYGWVFPHGDQISVGMGTANKGFSLRKSVEKLRTHAGLRDAETVRTEGAPIPLKTLGRWDNGQDIVVAGDAAGAVAPASGEGIYYAMLSGRFAADAAEEFVRTGNPKALRLARKKFMRLHGRVFLILGIMQRFWYTSDKRRERFVSICRDPDVQRLTWEAYMNKKLVRAKPLAHVRIFFKDLAHLMGLAPN
ncbi:MAG: geranylgeranyl diphosphate reductase [Gammaproteobacteria bacterium]